MRDQLYLLNANRKIQTLVYEMRKEFLREDCNSIILLKLYLMELLIQMNRQSECQFSPKRRFYLTTYVVLQLEHNCFYFDT